MKEICLNCYHFPVCVVHVKAREIQVWQNDIIQFYRIEARSCEFYEPNRNETEKEPQDEAEREQLITERVKVFVSVLFPPPPTKNKNV